MSWSITGWPPYSPTALHRLARDYDTGIVITYNLDHIGGDADAVSKFCELVVISPTRQIWRWQTGLHYRAPKAAPTGSLDAASDLGPIRPEHAVDGWRLKGDEDRWWLSKHLGNLTAKIRATTATTCAWTVYQGATVVQEASSRDVDEAKAGVDRWMRERP